MGILTGEEVVPTPHGTRTTLGVPRGVYLGALPGWRVTPEFVVGGRTFNFLVLKKKY